MNTLADLVAAGRERDGTAIDAHGRTAPYSYRDLCTNVWKTANLVGHYGTHPGSEVAVVPGPKEVTQPDWPADAGRLDSADPVLAVLGAALRTATVTMTPAQPVQARTLVVPAGWHEVFDTAPQCSVLAYGGPPADPAAVHFEAELWSENPTEPPEQVDPDTPALRAEETYTHGDLVTAAERVVERHGLGASSHVGLVADLRTPGALVAGVLAPLSVGATVVLADDRQSFETEALVVTDSGGGSSLSAPELPELLSER
jgi:hypothetical protein